MILIQDSQHIEVFIYEFLCRYINFCGVRFGECLLRLPVELERKLLKLRRRAWWQMKALLI